MNERDRRLAADDHRHLQRVLRLNVHGFCLRVTSWEITAPAGITCVQGGPVIRVTAVGCAATRLQPAAVVGAGRSWCEPPVLPGGWVPGAARSVTPQPNPALPAAVVHWKKLSGAPLTSGGFEKLVIALLLTMP